MSALAVGACAPAGDALGPTDPVLIVGIDGLDPVILGGLIEAGRVPNLARFAEEGTLGRLGTFAPTLSPVIWTTIATGQLGAEHGITDFLDGAGRPFTSNARRVPALWDLASAAGRRVDCTGWWATWPAERVNGRMVASYAAQAQAQVIWKPTLWDDLEQQTWPADLQAEIKPFVTLAAAAEELREPMARAFPIPAEGTAETERLLNDLAWSLAADLSVSGVAGHLLETGGADLSMCYLALPDVAGHRFWRYSHPEEMRYRVAPEQVEIFGDYINRAYIEADRMLGELLAKAPQNTTVIVLSDHGMHVEPSQIYAKQALASGGHGDAPPGVIGVLGPRAARGGNLLRAPETLGRVDQVAAMVLHLLGLGVPNHWPAARELPLAIEACLDETWRLEHGLQLVTDPGVDFREATPSTLPIAGGDEAFKQAFERLGYLGAGSHSNDTNSK